MDLRSKVRHQAGLVARSMRVAADTGLVRRDPRQIATTLKVQHKWGRTPAAGIRGQAERHIDEPYVIDELGMLTFGDVDRRSNALANALSARGVRAGDRVGLMCRNSRYFVDSYLAGSKLGATMLLLNTDFAGPQLSDVMARENAVALIADEEYLELLAGIDSKVPLYLGWTDTDPDDKTTLEDLVASAPSTPPEPPSQLGRMIVLTSGTTGTPKGAERGAKPPALTSVLGILERVPFRSRETHVLPAPMFHGWGLLHFNFSFLLSMTIVLRRRFDPEWTLRAMSEHRARSASLVPVMLQRILDLPDETRQALPTPELEIISLGGSAVPGGLAERAMDELGPVVYNTYGSTEVGMASSANPEDLRVAPGTAGKILLGVRVAILDDSGRELPMGETGRIFVGSPLGFEGYTGGGHKEIIDGLMSSGDVGHMDAGGRLFVSGRDDDMIVSGGENVFPREVEDLLTNLDTVEEAAVIGVPDDQFGQRLKAFVVVAAGHELTEDDVRDHVKANLARYKVPRDVEFLDELPRNPTGKILKRSLAER